MAVAANLVKRKYKSVTINISEDRYGNPLINKDFILAISKSRMKRFFNLPDEFGALFKADFIFMAGTVAVQLYEEICDPMAAYRDYKSWAEGSLREMPVKLKQIWQKFLFEYTYEILSEEVFWSNIRAVAAELRKRKALTHFQVSQIMINEEIKTFNSKIKEFETLYSINMPSPPEPE